MGYESWENIWGIWNQITPRDAEALRRVAKIERAFAGLLISPTWEPHTPTLRYGVFASKFPGQGQTLWTIVNRNEYDVEGRQITVPYASGMHFYDVWHGERVAARSRRRVFYDCPEQRGGLFCQHSANLVRCRRG